MLDVLLIAVVAFIIFAAIRRAVERGVRNGLANPQPRQQRRAPAWRNSSDRRAD